MKRKLLSLILTVCMVLSLMPSAALAGEVGTEGPGETEMVSGEIEKAVPTTDVKTTETENETQTAAPESEVQTAESQMDVSQNTERALEGDKKHSTAAHAQKNSRKGIAGQAVEEYDVYINGFRFSSTNLTYNGETGTAVYDPKSNTLTLNNLTVTGNVKGGGVIQSERADVSIVVNGKNKIIIPATMSAGSTQVVTAIASTGNMDIQGASGRTSDELIVQSESVSANPAWPDGTTRAAIIYQTGSLNIKNVTITMNDTSKGAYLGHSTAIYANSDKKLTMQNCVINTTNTQHGIYMNAGSASLKEIVFNVQNSTIADSSGVNLAPNTTNTMENCSGTIEAAYPIYAHGSLNISGSSDKKLILNGTEDAITVSKDKTADASVLFTYSGMNMEINAPNGLLIGNSAETVVNSGKITLKTSGMGVRVHSAESKLTLNNGTVDVIGTDSGENAVGIVSYGTVDIKGGALNTSSVHCAIQQMGEKAVTISGGTHTWTAAAAGYANDNSGALNISENADVTVNAPMGIQLSKDKKGGLNITGGTVRLNCTERGILSQSGAGKTSISGGKVIIKDVNSTPAATGINAAGELEISGSAEVSFENCRNDLQSSNNSNKISGGKVTLSGSESGLYITGNFAVTGGEIQSTGNGYGIYGINDDDSTQGTITFGGGKINLSGSSIPIAAFSNCMIDFAGAEVTAETTSTYAFFLNDDKSAYKVSGGEVILKSKKSGVNRMYDSLPEGYGVFAGASEMRAEIAAKADLNTLTANPYVRIAKAQQYTLTLVNVKEGTKDSVYGGAMVTYHAKEAEYGRHFLRWDLTVDGKTTEAGKDSVYTGKMPKSDAVLTAVYENCSGGSADCQNKAKCSICEREYGEYGTHRFGEWQIVKPATTTSKGEKKRVCEVCSYTEYDDIPILPQETEQFNLALGETYWFDLSDMNITGRTYASLPDMSQHYVPFTYVGTVNAYVLNSTSKGNGDASVMASQTTDSNAQYGYTYLHSLFMADYCVSFDVKWNQLNEDSFIFGKSYTAGNVNYIMRSPSVGSSRADSEVSASPQNNEWDVILDKGNQKDDDYAGLYIKRGWLTAAMGQDWVVMANVPYQRHAIRGERSSSVRSWGVNNVEDKSTFIGYRPVLEIQNADTLGLDGLRAVSVDLNGGSIKSTAGTIKIVVKSGESFTAPGSEGLSRPEGEEDSYFKWFGSDGKLYNPGDRVPADVSKLTAYWEPIKVTYHTDQYTVEKDNKTVKKAHGASINLEGPLFTRVGYTQTGWTTGQVNYEFGAVYTEDADIVLFPVWKDTQKPIGSISNGTYTWRIFVDAITDELFYKDAQNITIEASDNSGSVKAEYYVTDEVLSAEQLESVVWTKYTDTFRMDADGPYIVYAKLTDSSDNVTYLRSNRMTIDSVLPIVKGIEDGKTYCSARTFTVEEEYLQAVLIDNDPISPNAEGAYEVTAKAAPQKITVYDKAGNSVKMTVMINDGHTGGEADCKEKAVCEICREPYGDIDPTNHRHLIKTDAKAATAAENGNPEYWHCEDCDKLFSDADAKHEIKAEDTILSKLSPEIIEGKDGTWKKGEKNALNFKSNAAFADFRCVLVDNKEIDSENYTVSEGSTVVELKAEYLETLSVGKHKLTVRSAYGDAETTFEITHDHTGGKANCKEKAVCEICGESYGEVDPSNHVDLVKVDGKKATTAEEGNKEFWHCEDCGKYFSDADGKNEIKKEDTVIPKLKADTENKTPTKTPEKTPTETSTKTPEKTPAKTPAKTTTQKNTNKTNSPKTGDAYNICIWLVLLGISGGVTAGKIVTAGKRRRKR